MPYDVHVLDLQAVLAHAGNRRAKRARTRHERNQRALRPSRKNELWYHDELSALVRHLDTTARAEMHGLKGIWPAVHDAQPVDEVIHRIAKKFGGIDAVAERLAHAASLRNKGAADARAIEVIRRAVGVDITGALSGQGRIAEAMRRATAWNVQLIKSIPEEYLGKLGAAVGEAWEQGRRWEDIAAVLDHVGDVTESRVEIIARDQTAKMNSAFSRVRMLDVGVAHYEWMTAGDERVRGNPDGKYPDAESDHWDLDGKIFRFDEPGPCRGTVDGEPCHPGEDILDRCNALPVFNVEAAA